MNRFVYTIPMLLFSFIICMAQDKPHELSDEVKAEVPALKEFHTVIFHLWHNAWPAKDIAALKALVPDIEKHADAVAAAALPGILRDKRQAWQEGVEQLQTVVADYKSAAAGKDDRALLLAAEQLHAQYEKLVRVVRPPLPELDAFHTALYPLYHYYLPEYDLGKIEGSLPGLNKAMQALTGATLPPRRKTLEPAFVEKRGELKTHLDLLNKAVATGVRASIVDAVENLHTAYQSLEQVFE